MTRLLVGLALAAVTFAPSLEAGPELRRLALVAGANRGAPERVPLRYAVADAERFASVMTRLGGLAPDDGLTLKEPHDRLSSTRSRRSGLAPKRPGGRDPASR